ncbi:MAG TPA: VOC family protein [Steroidobacter sp.]|jgi:predicted enzyme related to lactoylglutathione lyase|nr:VOC family protein [Steroidobacteraceae bacterium]HLS83002.1 VOC family protein [Steroidobacter sp.]
MTDSAPTSTNRFSFTKVITKNLDGLASFYKTAFGMRELQRVRSSVNDEPIEEIILTISGDMASEPVLVLFDFLERPPLRESDVILGFIVGDLDATLARVKQGGGKVVAEPKIHDEGGARVRVAFGADPEGRLLEIVQMAF